MITLTEELISEVLMWAGELPSECVNPLSGMILSPLIISLVTAGSAFSLMVTPAVVCGINTRHMPLFTPQVSRI